MLSALLTILIIVGLGLGIAYLVTRNNRRGL
jgi:hypothetical protein